jgi:hypothetical protein
VTTPPRRPDATHGSSIRLLVGAALTVAAVMLALVGFLRLVSVLEGGGYGTTRMQLALVILGAAGALLAGGIATLIWDIAKRYESPGEPQVRDRHLPR